MNTSVIELLRIVIPAALRWGIPAIRDIIKLAYMEKPTEADWSAVFDKAEENAKRFLEMTKGQP